MAGPVAERLRDVVQVIAENSTEAAESVARALLDIARTYDLEMEWSLAIDVCETIEKLRRRVPALIVLEALRQSASCGCSDGRWDYARRRYGQLERLARRHSNDEYVLRSGVGVATITLECGNFPQALTLIDSVIDRARRLGDGGALAALWRALHTRGVLMIRSGRHLEGISQLREAWSLSDDAIQREGMLHDVAVGLVEIGVLSAARDMFLRLHESAANHSVRWSASINLMEIAVLQADAALFESRRAQLMTRRMRPSHYAHYLYMVAGGYERLGDLPRALQHYAMALSAGEALGVCEVVIRSEQRIAEVRRGRSLPLIADSPAPHAEVQWKNDILSELPNAMLAAVGT